jgi:rhomboid protease GluP
MDLQLFIAINLMSISGMAIVITLMQRPKGFPTWLVANAVVLLAGAASLLWSSPWSGAIVAGAFVPLVLAPGLLSLVAQRSILSNRKREAAFYSWLVAYLHPTARTRFAAALMQAQSRDTVDGEVAALRALVERATPDQSAMLQSRIARARDDWEGVLDSVRPSASVDLKSLEIRALGEVGRIDDMVRTYAAAKSKLAGLDRYLSHLFVMAFCGRVDSVRLLLEHQLPALAPDTKDYWIAIAAKASRGNDGAWRRSLERLASATQDSTTRRAAQRHLAAPDCGGALLTPESQAAVNDAEDWLRRQPQRRKMSWRRMPVTATLIALNVAGFVIEWVRGGPGDVKTLVELGAMWPPLVLQDGEWWRLATALFLHHDWLHIGSNLLLLYLFGRLCETTSGSIRTLVIYGLGGLASSACVLWLMWLGAARYGVFLGASGAIFALFGAEAVRQFLNWTRSRDMLDRRGLVILAGAILIEVAVDLNVAEISFAAHASGFATGAAIRLVMGMAKREAVNVARVT